jgi:hypothetical protein
MLSLKLPKINVGVHCLKLRTKSMYINAVMDPAFVYEEFPSGTIECFRP